MRPRRGLSLVLSAVLSGVQSKLGGLVPIPIVAQALNVVMSVGVTTLLREDMAIAEDVAANLRRHGAPARTLWEGRADDRAAGVILACAAHNNAGLIVAGAYGHSRLGEWVFGGVTRSLLNQTDRFVLFSH